MVYARELFTCKISFAVFVQIKVATMATNFNVFVPISRFLKKDRRQPQIL